VTGAAVVVVVSDGTVVVVDEVSDDPLPVVVVVAAVAVVVVVVAEGSKTDVGGAQAGTDSSARMASSVPGSLVPCIMPNSIPS